LFRHQGLQLADLFWSLGGLSIVEKGFLVFCQATVHGRINDTLETLGQFENGMWILDEVAQFTVFCVDGLTGVFDWRDMEAV
jgi:hypothetical protein